jgi:predicted RNA-binding Zn ribbon-like protein
VPSGRSARATLAAVATEAIDLLTGPDAQLLRACHAPGCVIYFVKDHSRREWCSTACGNRVRAARHYSRRIEGRRSDAHPG